MKKNLIFAAFLLTASLVPAFRASAQGYAPGAAVAAFSLKAADGKAVSLTDLATAKAVVVVFTNPFCPYTKLYEGRLAALAKAGEALGVRYLFVNPAPGEKPTSAQQVAATGSPDKLAGFTVLADEGQVLTKAFGATKTPEAFVLQPGGGQFLLRYRGAIDDNPQVESDVREFYLREAVNMINAGQAVKTGERRAAGCLIKTF